MTSQARWIGGIAALLATLGLSVVAFRTLDLLDGEGTIHHQVDGTVTINVNVDVTGTVTASLPPQVRVQITFPPGFDVRLHTSEPSPEGAP